MVTCIQTFSARVADDGLTVKGLYVCIRIHVIIRYVRLVVNNN